MYLALAGVETEAGNGVKAGATAPASLKMEVGAEPALLGAVTPSAGTANLSVSQSFKGARSQAQWPGAISLTVSMYSATLMYLTTYLAVSTNVAASTVLTYLTSCFFSNGLADLLGLE